MFTYVAQPYQAVKGAEVSGANVSALIGSKRDGLLEPFVRQSAFTDLDPNQWYSQQEFLELIRNIENSLTYEELVAIGMRSAEVVNLPPSIKGFADIPDAIVTAYTLNHRNTPPEEGYALERGTNYVAIVCNIPYPPFILFGYVHGLLRRFGSTDERRYIVKVENDELPYKIVVEW